MLVTEHKKINYKF